MTIDFAQTATPPVQKGEWFRAEASQVMDSLRVHVAEVLSELGDFTKPAEVQRVLQLDKTLSRQVFKLASNTEPMSSGNIVPSQTSIHRFLDVAKGRGISTGKIQGVLSAYKQFEQLIRTHAGDRVTFKSMVSAATGIDDEWLAADLQHRRNAFRTMSHTMGMQMKTKLLLFIINGTDDDKAYEVAVISASIGLRVLRPTPSIRVHGVGLSAADALGMIAWEPLILSRSTAKYILEPYCSKPLPALKITEGNTEAGNWCEIGIDHPEVGNMGTSTLFFGTLCRKLPVGSEPLRIHSTTGKPAELQVLDVLINPRIAGGRKPSGQAVLGFNDKFGTEVFPLEGNFAPESLGRGPAALSTPEVPRYSDMIVELGSELGWNLKEYNAFRIRDEYPLYHSTLTMLWDRQLQTHTAQPHIE